MDRRAFLMGTSAGAALWALGCHGGPDTHVATLSAGSEIRGYLHDAVARLAASFPYAHALAVQRRRVTAAVDVVGEGVSRGRAEGVVLTVRDAKGNWIEQVTSELTRQGIAAAASALAAKSAPSKSIDFGAPIVAPEPKSDPTAEPDAKLLERTRRMLVDPEVSSRIVYTAGVIDVDDARIWSVAPGRDLEQRLVRVRRSVTRVAWNGTRPIVTEAARGWTGGLDDATLPVDVVARATRGALRLMTQGAFEGGELPIALDPSVTALVISTATRALLTTDALQLPEVSKRLVPGAQVGATSLTLVDDPGTKGAYGGFAFDDEGAPAAPITLLDAGRIANRLATPGRSRRHGHLGPLAPSPTHLRLARGDTAPKDLLADGFRLEGAETAAIDPVSGRASISVARAVEIKKGHETGRVFADVELVGELATLLAQVTAISSDGEITTARDESDRLPLWTSVDAPAVATRGLVRARRSGT